MHRRIALPKGIAAAPLCLLSCVLAAAAQPIQYRVSFPAPEHHYAQVEVTWPAVSTGTLEARMSRSSPGRYAVHEFSKNVFDVHAFDGQGRELRTTRPSPYQWNVSGHDGTVRITYKVFGNQVDGTYLAVDDTHAHMNMPATLMWARGFDTRQARITFVPPTNSSWKPATQLFPTADPWTFTAPNLQYLMDSPTELSAYTLRSFKVKNPDGKEFTIYTAVHHDGDAAVIDDYAAGAEKIVNEAAAIFGEFPNFDTGTYTFLGDYVPWGGGDGMEHRNSTVVASAVSFRNPQAARLALGTVSHEFFHCWNVERIRPRTLEPFNFEEANISGELWLAEGFTQYYGPLVMTRAGVSDADPVALVRNAVFVINSPARQFRSAVEMSQMAAFSDAAVAIDETNLSTTFLSYYTYGAALATALDLSLRDRSNGTVTLDDYMRGMWRVHGKPAAAPGYVERPYTLADARARLAEVSDRAFADDFFNRYVEGREVPDFAKLLEAAGVTVRPRNTDGWTGAAIDASGRVSAQRGTMEWGSPAFEAGLEHEDVLISVDGQPFSQALLKDRKPGDRVTFEVKHRGGVTGKGTLTFGTDPSRQAVLNESAGKPLTAEQKAFRMAWLGSQQR
jgi:predicted metalloprotease with PDZ domain